MENGTFQTRLSDLSFQDDHKSTVPNSQRTSSLQSLIQQNEDLSLRLKFSIQKMAELEDQNDQVATDNRKLLNTIQALNDQLLIWKEKERLWQEKLAKSEYQYLDLKESVPDLKELNAELARYHRYHEKVKTQIKPYIQQLKDYAKGLSDHIKELNLEVERRDFNIEKLTTRNTDIENELSSHLSTHARIIEDLKKFYETEVLSLRKENTQLRDNLIVAEKKAEQLDSALERQDELLNQTIVLKRKNDELRENYLHESEGLRQSLNISRNEIIQKTAQLESLLSNEKDLESQTSLQKEQIGQLQDQLAGLRILWTEKTTEAEKLILTNESLERLNAELSQKLRNQRESSPE